MYTSVRNKLHVNINEYRGTFGNLGGWKFILGRRGMTSVSKSESPSLINHHDSTSFPVSHADIQVSVLTDVFDIIIP